MQPFKEQGTENNRNNGQSQTRDCNIFNGCFGFDQTFDPLKKITKKFEKITNIINFKKGKIRKVLDIKNAKVNLLPTILQLEIEKIRGAQAALDTKLGIK